MASVALRPKTLRETFSFYVSGRSADRILTCSTQADAVVALGLEGPATVKHLRTLGWPGTVIFDAGGYSNRTKDLNASKWFDEQRSAGADRILTPGQWVGLDPEDPPFSIQIESEVNLASSNGATCLLAIDYRWLISSARQDEMLTGLVAINSPIALVLGDPRDPLGHPGAVEALAKLCSQLKDLSILRSDQGGIGALAFGAAHAAIGLTSTHRHMVPPGVKAFAIPNDRTARVFVRDLMDWFTVSRIGSWSTTNSILTCSDSCCEGQALERFLDKRLNIEADLHNRTVITTLAEDVLSVPNEDGTRRREFGRMCQEAVLLYGTMGNWMTLIQPKSQLTQWALYF